MRYIEWIIAGILIVAGLICLSMAPSAMMGNSMGSFWNSLITVCLWTAVPIVIIGILYLFIGRKKQ